MNKLVDKVPDGYALVSIDALKAWGKYDEVRNACQFQAEQAEQETVATDLMDMLRLIETIKYLRGIAERGLGREIRDDETIEQFVLGYVKQLEAAPVRTKDLTDDELKALWENTKGGWLGLFRAVIAKDRERNR